MLDDYIGIGNDYLIVSLDARYDEVAVYHHSEVAQRTPDDEFVLYFISNHVGNEQAVGVLFFYHGGLVGIFYPEDEAHQYHGQNDAYDTQRIGHRISQRNLGNLRDDTVLIELRESLLGSTQTRRIGDSTREDTYQHGHLYAAVEEVYR